MATTKKCEEGKILNPVSNRCVSKTGKIGKSLLLPKEAINVKRKDKRCEDGKILNPVSNRCVSKTGKIGKSLLLSSPKKSASHKSPRRTTTKALKCPYGKMFNPKTGKCINILKKERKHKTPSPPVKKTPVKKTPVKKTVFNPYYRKDFEISSPENCDMGRPSISTLAQDIKNVAGEFCDVLPVNDVQYILGPHSYSEYKYNGKNICIFGEYHTSLTKFKPADTRYLTKANTLTMAGFLASLFTENKDIFYDFFLEIDYVNSTATMRRRVWEVIRNANMFMLERAFYSCLLPKAQCPYKNIRAHYIDTRKKISPAYNNIIFNLDVELPPEVEKFDPYILFYQPIVLKELKKSYFGLKIFEFITKKFSELSITLQDNIRVLRMRQQGLLMDIYTLSRIFKKFAPGKGPSEPENIIIYAGDLHSELYREFMETELGLKPIIKISDPDKYFIDTTELRARSSLFRK